LMVENMNCPPERLFRPDGAIVAWRRWCQEKARRSPAESATSIVPVTAAESVDSIVQNSVV